MISLALRGSGTAFGALLAPVWETAALGGSKRNKEKKIGAPESGAFGGDETKKERKWGAWSTQNFAHFLRAPPAPYIWF